MHVVRWLFLATLTLAACYFEAPTHRAAGGAAATPGADSATEDDASSVDAGDACGCDPGSNRPVCSEAGECVACTQADLSGCSALDAQRCSATGECVACTVDAHCTDPATPHCTDGQCTKCSADVDCAHIPGANVCGAAGGCVVCTSDKNNACTMAAGGPFTCHGETHVCTTTRPASVAPCGVCQSDADCTSGHLCVTTEYQATPVATARYCLPVNAGGCIMRRPFVGGMRGVSSIDGRIADVCALAVSSCAAHTAYRNTFCGIDAAGVRIPISAATGYPSLPAAAGDDALCGLDGVNDGYCVQDPNSSGIYRCSVACTGGVIGDCPVDAPACANAAYGSGAQTRYLCTFP
ncbi:MAG: hypothetical protein RL385_3280 [Pseudomonadota bacterium]|jgi:hypothetical protein